MTVHAITPAVRKPLPAATHLWGVDPSAAKGAAIAFWDLTTDQFQTNLIAWGGTSKNPGERLMLCRASVREFAEAMRNHWPPVAIAVERPAGPRPNPPLVMHAGVIAEALGAGGGVAPYFVATAEWRATLGVPMPRSDKKAAVVEWAHSIGWKGGTEDEAEALGVCFSGVQWWRKALVA